MPRFRRKGLLLFVAALVPFLVAAAIARVELILTAKSM